MGLVELKKCKYRIFNDYDEHYNELRYDNFKKYGQFVHEINNDLPLTYHQELDDCRENLKTLFDVYDLPRCFSDYDDWWRIWGYYVDACVYISKHCKDVFISPKTIDFIRHKIGDLRAQIIMNTITLYAPHEAMSDPGEYFNACRVLITDNCRFYYLNKPIDTGNEFLDRLYHYLHDLKEQGIDKELLKKEEGFISFLVAYILYYNIDNFDMIYYYLTNKEEIKEKLILNNCSVLDDDNHYILYKDIDPVVFLFNNFDKVFNYKKVLIK